MKDFDPTNIQIVEIDKVKPNEWNPKLENTPEFQKIVESIEVNGFKQPIIVRQVEGEDGYEICDGCQRWTAAKQLGFDKIYVYNLGFISDEEAKSITIWMEQNVPFDEITLAPLVAELKNLDIQIPYSEDEVRDFVNMLNFDFTGDDRETLSIKCPQEQLDKIKEILDLYTSEYDVTEDIALVELVKLGVKRYE